MTQVIRQGLLEFKENRYVTKVCGLEYFNVSKVSYDSSDDHEFVDEELWFTFYTTADKLVNYLRYIAPRLDYSQKLIISDGGQVQAIVVRDMIVYLNGLKNYLRFEEDELYKWNHSTIEERVKILEEEDKPVNCNELPY